jgi:soluble lytic murein transglycosylase
MTCAKTRNTKKQILVLTMLSTLFICNQSCQTYLKKDIVVFDDHARIEHAQQLLQLDYATSDAKQFEGDKSFDSYLERYISSENSNLNSVELSKALVKLGREHNYDPVFLLAVIKTESRFNPNAIGTHGEIGLMQIKPVTAEWITGKKKFTWKGSEALKDPSYNMQVGTLYFDYLKKSLNSYSAHYINAYNLGMGNLRRLPAAEKLSHPYYERVFSNYIAIYQELQKIRKTI